MLSLILAVAATAAAPAPAQPSPIMARYMSLALDPAGKRIATVDSEQARSAPSAGHGTIVLRSISGKVIERYDPCETCAYAGLSWSPDGKSLAYVASGGGTATLYVLADGASRKVTSLKGLAATPRWSADGKTIAFLATVDAAKESGATQPGVRQVGLIGTKTDSRRIAIVPAAGGDYRLVSPEGVFVYEYDWMPDGAGFVGTAAEGDGDNQWWVASLRAFPIDGAMRTIAAPKLQLNFPRVSPDGQKIAFISGLMSDYPVVGGDIFTVPLAGGTPTNLTPGAKASFTSLAWSGGRLVAGVTVGGSTGVATIDASGTITGQAVTAETIAAGDGAVAVDGKGAYAAYVAESFTAAPAIAFGPLGKGHKISHENDALPPMLTARDIKWRNDGRDVQGWLLAPTTTSSTDTSAAKAPMITIVHGGPASASTPRYPWGNEVGAFLANDYYVFLPNPRGSFGQGEAFVRANVKDFGGGDLQDILAGIDAVEKVAPIDDKRLGIYGHSYGGFMTMWAVTQTHRFGAAVAGAGIADWVAYYGQNGIDQWMIPFFGASAYDDPATYDRMSPIRYIKNAKTPTFLYVGERDIETPAVQSLEYWHGLRAMGVPSELMIYQDEGHGIRDPKNLKDRETRLIGWFDRWLPAR
jgi:dipeptidyl aminopeptidase/acylaminoacyl peptidase